MSRRRIYADYEIQCLHRSCRIRHVFEAGGEIGNLHRCFGELRGCRPNLKRIEVDIRYRRERLKLGK